MASEDGLLHGVVALFEVISDAHRRRHDDRLGQSTASFPLRILNFACVAYCERVVGVGVTAGGAR